MTQVFFVCLFAGVVAGIEIGFASVSAATIIAPILIALLGVPWYEAIGIGLAADVLAAAFSAYEYRKQIDVKNGLIMLVSVLIMTFVGSYFSQYLPDTEMGWLSVVLSLICGLRFLRSAKGKTGKNFLSFFLQRNWMKIALAIVVGCYIGFWCGFVGAGGGMMTLFGLTIILRYEVKTAVGTGVFIMIFTALIGAVSHVYFGDMQDYIPAMIFCIIFTFLAAWISSKFANRMETKKTNLVTGTILLILCVCLIIKMAVSLA